MGIKVCVVGIGLMGSGMAQAILRSGLDVVGFDISAQSRNAAEMKGISVTGNLSEAVSSADIIVSSLPNSAIVRDAWFGADGILSFAKSGAVAVEVSSIDPSTMKELAENCRKAGLGVVDSPVSGGPDEAESGALVLMIGGEDADIQRAMPVLQALGTTHFFTGEVGTGKIVKLVNNLMTMGNVLIASEAFAMGTAAGVDPDKLYDALSQSGGRSHHFTKRFPKALKKDYEPGFTMQLGEKDVALAIDFARSINRPMPAASMVREMMMIAMGLGYRDKDIVALLDMYQRIGSGNGFDGKTTKK